MENCVIYAISREEIRGVLDCESIADLPPIQCWEVWRGLPKEYDFKAVSSRGGALGLKAEITNVFIWIPPNVREELEKNPDAIIEILVTRTKKGLAAPYAAVNRKTDVMSEIIQGAKALNVNILRETFSKLAQRSV